MKKILIALFAIFVSISAATATTPTNPALATAIQASLAQGASIDQVIAQFGSVNSIYSKTEVLGTLAEIVDPIHFNNILAATQALNPTFVPIIQSIIDSRIAAIAAAGGVVPDNPIPPAPQANVFTDPLTGLALDPTTAAADPTAAFAPTAAGASSVAPLPIAPINVAFNNPVSGVIQPISP